MSVDAHITAALEYYLSSDIKTNHALMITGAWGSGKTHFISKFIEDWQKKNPPAANADYNPVCYISLDGVQTVEELQKLLFIQLYPMKGKIRNSISKLGISRISLSIPSIISVSLDPDKLGKTFDRLCTSLDGTALFFDDLERCKIPVEVLFGFINQFAEHSGQRVILIANEEKIKNSESEIKNPAYEEIKEKLVGTTLELQTSPESVLEYFIGEMTERAAKDCVTQNKITILRIFNELKIYNYRSLRIALYEFSRLFKKIEDIFPRFMEQSENAQESRCNLLILTLVIVFLARANKISLRTLSNANLQEISCNLEKFTNIPALLAYDKIAFFFTTAIIKKQDILPQLENHILFYQPKDGEKLEWSAFKEAIFWCLDETEFSRLQKRFQHEIEHHYIRKINDIFNLACSLTIWKQKQGNELPFIKPDIGTYFSDYIKNLANNNELIFENKNEFIKTALCTYSLESDDNLKRIDTTYQKLKEDRDKDESDKFLDSLLKGEIFSFSEIFNNGRQEKFIQNQGPGKIAVALFSIKKNIRHSPLYEFLRTYFNRSSSFTENEKKWFASLEEELKKLAAKKQLRLKDAAENIIEQLFSH